MRENFTGLILSGLLHAGLIGWVANTNYLPEKDKAPEVQRHLTVNLFQAEKTIKPVVKKAETISPQKNEEILAREAPKKQEESKPPKPIVVAKSEPVPSIEKIQPIIIPEPVKSIISPPPPKRTISKPKKKIVLKPKKKKKKRVVKKPTPRRKVIKKRIVKKLKPKRKTIVRKVKPQKKLAVKAQRPRIFPAPKRISRKAPVVKKYVKRGGVGIQNKNRRPATRQAVKKTPQTYQKPTHTYHKPATVHQKRKPVNSAAATNLTRQYKARLHRLIASVTKKNYPKRAKRRNQQGRVSLSFTISHSGKITNIKILKSSGAAILDKAAIRAIQRVSQKLPFLNGMPKSSLNLKMTVAYVLH